MRYILCCVLMAFVASTSADCTFGKRCTLDIAGSKCGDGATSFINLIEREGAEKLFVFLQGGGACWSKTTCGCLDRTQTCAGISTIYLRRPPIDGVKAVWADPSLGPIGEDFNVIEIPYCTGDAHTGSRLFNYGTAARPLLVHHWGYENVRLSLEEAKRRFPYPRDVVVLGVSAGGLGLIYNFSLIKKIYPHANLYLIADSGAPWQSPYVAPDRMREVLANWRTIKSSSRTANQTFEQMDFGEMIRYNASHFQSDRFALISSYHDVVMASYLGLLGTSEPFDAMSRLLIQTADMDLASNPRHRVFLVRGIRHRMTREPLIRTVSKGITLEQWITDMLDENPNWTSVTPHSDEE